MNNQESTNHAVLGQKYAYATASLVLGILCFVNVAGMEKAIVAIVFAWLALKSSPPPQLTERRLWAKIAIGLASFVLIFIPTIIILNLHRLQEVLDALAKLSEGK